MSVLSVKNLIYGYSKGTPFEKGALKDVTLSFNEGDIVAIIGHTGSGKSTLLQHLNGLLKPDSGDVLFEDVSIYSTKGLTTSTSIFPTIKNVKSLASLIRSR